MLNCKEVVKIISSEERPTWRHKLEVRFHLMICRHCSKYAQQIEMLKVGFKNFFSNKIEKANKNKIQDLEDRVIKKIHQKD